MARSHCCVTYRPPSRAGASRHVLCGSGGMEAFILGASIQVHHRDIPHPVYILNSTSDTPRHSLDEGDPAHARLQDTADATHSFSADSSIQLKPPVPFDSARINCHCTNPTIPKITTTHTRPRSLTDVSIFSSSSSSADDEMTSLATDAPPGSPPGLSGSKSSKSSSDHSSSQSGTDGIISDIGHFEDIGLDEDTRPFVAIPNGMEKISRPPPRTSATTGSGHRNSAAALTTIRELTSAAAHRSPPLGGAKGHPPTHSLSLPNPGLLRRGYRNASTPSLAITAMSNCNRSRSPSPNPTSPLHRPMPSPLSPRRPGLPPTDLQHPARRRTSWQPSRKSIKELEAEYTEDDGDDDLPDDASLWNVPLSPRPPTERMPLSASTSPKPSPCASPERMSPLRTSPNIQMINAPKTSPAVSDFAASPSIRPPASPRHHKLVRGASTGVVPDHYGFPHGRAKSWNVVLSELSEDAKALTETLETHAGENERKQEEAIQNGSVSPEPGNDRLSRSKSTPVELPPLRLNNIMIDPLPISKEKEKVLTRTRPSWLPPKSQKEEKKHLKEYQRMMEMSREAEKRKAAKAANNQSTNENRKSALLHIWEEHVLPNWDQVVREPRTRELWWRGVAPKSRAEVWQKAIGNELALTEVTSAKALNRAKDIEGRIAGGRLEEYRMEQKWFDAIHRDVKVTLPELNIFQAGGPLHDGLVDVLMAYSMYRSDVGYSHGTHVSQPVSFAPLHYSLAFLCRPETPNTDTSRTAHSRHPSSHPPSLYIEVHNTRQSTQSPTPPRIPNRRPSQHPKSLRSDPLTPLHQIPALTCPPLWPRRHSHHQVADHNINDHEHQSGAPNGTIIFFHPVNPNHHVHFNFPQSPRAPRPRTYDADPLPWARRGSWCRRSGSGMGRHGV